VPLLFLALWRTHWFHGENEIQKHRTGISEKWKITAKYCHRNEHENKTEIMKRGNKSNNEKDDNRLTSEQRDVSENLPAENTKNEIHHKK